MVEDDGQIFKIEQNKKTGLTLTKAQAAAAAAPKA